MAIGKATTDIPVFVAGIGPGSAVLETLATTVGAGIVLGGFLAGAFGLFARGRPTGRQLSDAGYAGGVVAVAVVLADSFALIVASI